MIRRLRMRSGVKGGWRRRVRGGRSSRDPRLWWWRTAPAADWSPSKLIASIPFVPARVRDFIQRRWLFLSLLAAAPVVEYLAATDGAPGPAIALVRNPFAAIAAATVFCRYFIRDFRGGTRRSIVYLTPLTWLTAVAIEGQAAPPVLLWLDMLFGLGVLG